MSTQLVLSVTRRTETCLGKKGKRSLKHIKKFTKDSLLVKSADVLANYSELVDDYSRYGDEVFNRFNALKKLIIHQLKVISAILSKWKENPLYWDLVFLAGNLREMCSGESGG